MTPLIKFCQFVPNAKPPVDYQKLTPTTAATRLIRETVALHYVEFMTEDSKINDLLQEFKTYLRQMVNQLMTKLKYGQPGFDALHMSKLILEGAALGTWSVEQLCNSLFIANDPYNELACYWLPYLHHQRLMWVTRISEENTTSIVAEEVVIENAKPMFPRLEYHTDGSFGIAMIDRFNTKQKVQLWSSNINDGGKAPTLSGETLPVASPLGFLIRYSWERASLSEILIQLSKLSMFTNGGGFYSYLKSMLQEVVTNPNSDVLFTINEIVPYYRMSARCFASIIEFCTVLIERDHVSVDAKSLAALCMPGLEKQNKEAAEALKALLQSNALTVSNQASTEQLSVSSTGFVNIIAYLDNWTKPNRKRKVNLVDPAKEEDAEDDEEEEDPSADEATGAPSPDPEDEDSSDDQSDPDTESEDPDAEVDDSSIEEDPTEDEGTEENVDDISDGSDTPEEDSAVDDTTHTQSKVTVIDGVEVTSAEPVSYSGSSTRIILQQRIEQVLKNSTTLSTDEREALKGIVNYWLNLLDLASLRLMLNKVLAGKPELDQILSTL